MTLVATIQNLRGWSQIELLDYDTQCFPIYHKSRSCFQFHCQEVENSDCWLSLFFAKVTQRSPLLLILILNHLSYETVCPFFSVEKGTDINRSEVAEWLERERLNLSLHMASCV